MTTPLRNRSVQLFLLLASGVLGVCALLFVVWTWHWPLVGDASLIHYICFLMDHGMAPYRDVGDMNMPGSFLVEWTVMHLLGGGALAWRIFDFLLLIVAGASMVAVTRPYSKFAGFFAAALFALVHGRDGMAQGGQRDLTMAVALLVATAFLFRALRRDEGWAVGVFGLFAGVALTIKPTALPFAAGLLALWAYTQHRRDGRALGGILAGSLALSVAPLGAAFFLWKEGAVGAFFQGLRTIVPYYASLGHRPLSYLLTHSISPLLPLMLIWLALLAAVRPRLTAERAALLGGVLFGLVSYVVQARGYPYYRYPLLAFLLPLMAIDLAALLRQDAPKVGRFLGFAGIAVGAFVIAPISAWSIHQDEWRSLDFITSLETTLNRLGGPELSGHIQCIDSISGCGTTLYRMRLVQATGVLSDFLLFGPGDKPVIRETRAQFAQAIGARPPTVMVVSSYLHIGGPDAYAKLERWPEFRDFLATRYCKAVDWTPSRPQRWWSMVQWPNGYRVYILRGSPAAAACLR